MAARGSHNRIVEFWSWIRRHQLALLGLAFIPAAAWLFISFCLPSFCPLHDHPTGPPKYLTLRILKDALSTGAVCLDGTPPAYHFRKGAGSGATRWILFFEGGGWCYSKRECVWRSKGGLGSSKYLSPRVTYGGMFSNKQDVNPDFYNWNVAYVHYCDGGSFAGGVDTAVVSKGKKIFFRGRRIVDAVVDDLMASGLNKSTHVMIGGCSAGGLSTFLNCDYIRSRLGDNNAVVKCLSDAGMFLDIPDITGTLTIQPKYERVFNMQNIVSTVDKACLQDRSPSSSYKCFFAQYLLPHIKTPFFVLNSNYDTWSLANIFVPRSADPDGDWEGCIMYSECNSTQAQFLRAFNASMREAVRPAIERQEDGVFAYSAASHCVTHSSEFWTGLRIGDEVLRDAVGSWFLGRAQNATWLDDKFPIDMEDTM
ncbi:hypothetical protein CBR_g23068 [Chara braunii]|uniref:Pectin acetylesterase n=1 Tax=Chara braunii TaxID=69332 RepID=A0A388L3S4_CHABU|nr:hypothetical protein CBR_g23068 [Chara braunii]|eukprot:GBG76853.1 hypothetical protein CBR_g23068 [Chara braunii]